VTCQQLGCRLFPSECDGISLQVRSDFPRSAVFLPLKCGAISLKVRLLSLSAVEFGARRGRVTSWLFVSCALRQRAVVGWCAAREIGIYFGTDDRERDVADRTPREKAPTFFPTELLMMRERVAALE
jgi:hypothetical protein